MALAMVSLAVWTLGQLVFWSSDLPNTRREYWTKNAGFAKPFRKNWLVATDSAEARLDHLKHGVEERNWWQQIQRLRAGNQPVRTIRFACLTATLLLFIPVYTQWQWGFGEWFGGLAIAALMILAATFSQIGSTWRMRIAVLPLEVLRPQARATLQRQIALAFLADILPIVAIAAGLQAVAVNVGSEQTVRWQAVPLSFLVWLVTFGCVTIAVNATVVVIHRWWLAMAIAIFTAYFCVFSSTAFLQWSRRTIPLSAAKHSTYQLQLWIPILVGLALSYLMARRWFRMEIGARQ